MNVVDLHSRVRRRLLALSRGIALVGGAAMVISMLIVVASVATGLFGKPILGESEMVGFGIAISVFCFLPLCHLLGQNIAVDFFSKPLPQAGRDILDVIMNVAFAFVVAFITWRLAAGALSAYASGTYSMFLRLPEWPVYLIGVVAGVLWVLVAVFVSFEAVLRAVGILPPAENHADFG